eukprot:Hpha_TRINITY_DN13754_c0_g2::TRINITY_DN13754_c0_g2_i1::g.142771::m.142771
MSVRRRAELRRCGGARIAGSFSPSPSWNVSRRVVGGVVMSRSLHPVVIPERSCVQSPGPQGQPPEGRMHVAASQGRSECPNRGKGQRGWYRGEESLLVGFTV